jgi:hypothetical protein
MLDWMSDSTLRLHWQLTVQFPGPRIYLKTREFTQSHDVRCHSRAASLSTPAHIPARGAAPVARCSVAIVARNGQFVLHATVGISPGGAAQSHLSWSSPHQLWLDTKSGRKTFNVP